MLRQLLGHTCEEHQYGLPALPEVHSCREEQDLQTSIQGINTVVEQLAQRA